MRRAALRRPPGTAMRLTGFTDYTLRVLLYLGAHREGKHLVTIGDIAAAYAISENHLMKVVHHLAKGGFIATTRGKGGGMRLARPPEQINLGDVVRNTEEDLAVVECFRDGNVDCHIAADCALRETLGHAMQAFLEVLDDKTIADILKPQRQI